MTKNAMELPEPEAWQTHTGPWGDRSTDYAYTAKQMHAYAADARRQALEDAARACEHFAAQGPDSTKAEALRDMAALIRALMETPK